MAAGVILLAGNARFTEEILLLKLPNGVEANTENLRVAQALRRLTTENAVVGVVWAGVIPYHSERRAVDFLGKSDRYVAQLPPDLSGATGWAG